MLDRPGLLAAGPPIFTCTTNKSISNLAGSQMASLQTLDIVGHRPLKASMATVSQTFEGLDIQQGGYE